MREICAKCGAGIPPTEPGYIWNQEMVVCRRCHGQLEASTPAKAAGPARPAETPKPDARPEDPIQQWRTYRRRVGIALIAVALGMLPVSWFWMRAIAVFGRDAEEGVVVYSAALMRLGFTVLALLFAGLIGCNAALWFKGDKNPLRGLIFSVGAIFLASGSWFALGFIAHGGVDWPGLLIFGVGLAAVIYASLFWARTQRA